jgi:nucleoside-diphosphate-sugar epimerase
VQPEIVFHLASLFLPQHQPTDVDRLIQSNVQFGTQLLEVMREKGVKHIVNTGTSWQHHLNISDRATNLYAATKQAFERILDYYTEAYQFSATTLYVFDSYGPNDPRKKLISLLWANAQGQTALEMSLGEQLIDLVHVDDLVRAFVLAAQEQTLKPGQHSRFGLSSGRAMPLKELTELFAASCGVALKINWGGRPYRDREVMKTWTTYTPLPNWAPEIALEQGLPRSTP